jgi:hypothetical protein
MDTTQSLVEIIFLLSVATILEAIAIGLLLRRLRYATRPIRVVALQAYPPIRSGKRLRPNPPSRRPNGIRSMIPMGGRIGRPHEK